MYKVFIAILILFITINSSGQNDISELKKTGYSILADGLLYLDVKDYEKAIETFNFARDFSIQHDLIILESESVAYIYYSLLLHHKLNEAEIFKKTIQDGLNESRDLGLPHRSISFELQECNIKYAHYLVTGNDLNIALNNYLEFLSKYERELKDDVIAYIFGELSELSNYSNDDLSSDFYNKKAIELAKLSSEYLVLGEALLNRAVYKNCSELTQLCFESLLSAKEAYDKLGIPKFRFRVLEQIFNYYQNIGDDVNSKIIANEYYNLASKSKLKFHIANGYKYLGENSFRINSYPESINFIKQELLIRGELNDSTMIARCYGDLAFLYNYKFDIDSLVYFGNKAFSIFEKLDNVNGLMPFLNIYLGALDLQKNDSTYSDVVEFIIKRIEKIENKGDVYYSFKTIGDYYAFRKKPPDYYQAENFLRVTYQYAEENNNWKDEIIILLQLATIYSTQKKYDQVKLYAELALDICQKNNCEDKGAILSTLMNSLVNLKDSSIFVVADSAIKLLRVSYTDKQLQFNADQNIILIYGDLLFPGVIKENEILLRYALDAEEFSKNISDPILQLQLFNILASAYERLQNFEKVVYFNEKQLELDTKINNNKDEIILLCKLVSSLAKVANNKSNKLDYYLQRLKKIIATAHTEREYSSIIQTLKQLNMIDLLDDSFFSKSILSNSSKDPIIYDNYAEFLITKEKYDSALVYYNMAYEGYLNLNFKLNAAFVAKNIANIYKEYLFDFEKALKFADISIDYFNAYKESDGDYAKAIDQLYLVKAMSYMHLGLMNEFLEFAKLGLRSYPEYSDLMYFLKAIANQSEDRDSLQYYLDKTISSNLPNMFKIYAVFMKLEYVFEDSVKYNEMKEIIMSSEVEDNLFGKNSPWNDLMRGIKAFFNNEMIYKDLFDNAEKLALKKGSFLDKARINKTVSILHFLSKNNELAYTYIKKAIEDLENHITLLSSEKSINQVTSLAFSADLLFFQRLARFLYLKTNNENYLTEIIDYTELLSTRITLKSLLQTKMGVSSLAKLEIPQLLSKISEVNKEIMNSDNDSKIERLIQERVKLLEKLRYLKENIKGNISLVKPVTVEMLQDSLLNDNSVIIKYYLNYLQSFAILINKETIELFKLPNQKEIELNVKIIKNFYSFYDKTNLNEQQLLANYSYKLFESLVYPVYDKITNKNLIIIPDKILNYLPFELLVCDTTSNQSKSDNLKANYLIQNCSISYAPSLTLYYHLSNKSTNINVTDVLLVGKSNFTDIDSNLAYTRSIPNIKSINNLPGVEEELNLITNSLLKIDQNINIVTYLNNDAKEKSIKGNDLSKFKYLHFATHGIVDDDYPDFTGILFDEITSSADVDDGVLNTIEIMELKLNSDLVVLSACNTALGKLVSGEGIIGLNRSFFISGARSVCSTLWSIPDESTSIFMSKFYNYIFNGFSKSLSLQKTKLDMIKSEKYSSPYYWAPYILSGAIN